MEISLSSFSVGHPLLGLSTSSGGWHTQRGSTGEHSPLLCRWALVERWLGVGVHSHLSALGAPLGWSCAGPLCAALVFDIRCEVLCLDETTSLELPVSFGSYKSFCLFFYRDLARRDVVDELFLFRTECSHSELCTAVSLCIGSHLL